MHAGSQGFNSEEYNAMTTTNSSVTPTPDLLQRLYRLARTRFVLAL